MIETPPTVHLSLIKGSIKTPTKDLAKSNHQSQQSVNGGKHDVEHVENNDFSQDSEFDAGYGQIINIEIDEHEEKDVSRSSLTPPSRPRFSSKTSVETVRKRVENTVIPVEYVHSPSRAPTPVPQSNLGDYVSSQKGNVILVKSDSSRQQREDSERTNNKLSTSDVSHVLRRDESQLTSSTEALERAQIAVYGSDVSSSERSRSILTGDFTKEIIKIHHRRVSSLDSSIFSQNTENKADEDEMSRKINETIQEFSEVFNSGSTLLRSSNNDETSLDSSEIFANKGTPLVISPRNRLDLLRKDSSSDDEFLKLDGYHKEKMSSRDMLYDSDSFRRQKYPSNPYDSDSDNSRIHGMGPKRFSLLFDISNSYPVDLTPVNAGNKNKEELNNGIRSTFDNERYSRGTTLECYL